MIQPQKTHVAILDCDETVPGVRPVYGLFYGSMFVKSLNDAARRSNSGAKIVFSSFNLMENQYPDPEEIDAIMITGSHSSVYDRDPWALKLGQFLCQIYNDYPRIRIFGSCFGHQIVAYALLEQNGVVVEKDPKGYELGVGTINLTPSFTSRFRQFLVPEDPSKLRIQFSHGDHVYCPTETLPPSWECIGTTSHCANQGYLEPSRVLTFQGHFEYDTFVMSKIIEHFYTVENGFAATAVKASLEAAAQSDDSARIADLVFAFLTAQS